MLDKNDVILVDESDLSESHVGLFCTLCDFIICTHEDIYNMRENNCCNECYLSFCQARKDDWSRGWRPDKETLDRYKQQRSILNIRLNDILGD